MLHRNHLSYYVGYNAKIDLHRKGFKGLIIIVMM